MGPPSDPASSSSTSAADVGPTRPCPECNAEWPDDIRYCGACGARMPDATVVASPYGVQVEASAAPQPASPPSASSSDRNDSLRTRPLEKRALVVADPSKIVNIPPATPLFVAPEPKTLETRRDVALDVINEAWASVTHRRTLLGLGTLVVLLAAGALSSAAAGISARVHPIAGLAAGVVAFIALGPLYCGALAIVGLRMASGRRVELNDFFDGFSRGLWQKLVVTWLLSGVLVGLASCFFVLPGIYLAIAFAYTPLLVIDRGEDPWSAMKISMNGVNAQFASHLVLVVVLGLVNVAGAMCCGLGVLYTIPLTAVALGVSYGRVFGFAGGVDRVGR